MSTPSLAFGAAFLLALPAAGVSQEPDREVPATVADRCGAVLREARDKDHRADLLAAALVELGPEAVEPLIDFLVEGRIGLPEGEPPQALSVPQREILLTAVAGLPRSPLDARLPRLEASEELADRRAAVHLLGATGTAGQLERLFRVALLEGENELDRRVQEGLTQAVQRVLERDGRGFAVLYRGWTALRDELLPAVLTAAGATRDARALALFAAVIERRPEHLDLVASQVAKAGSGASGETKTRLTEALRARLEDASTRTSRAAACALAALGDDSSVGLLIGWLGSEDRGLAATAHTCLQRMTGLALAGDPKVWQAWHGKELAWFRKNSSTLPERLRSQRTSSVAALLHEISERRLHRDELASEVAAVLRHADPTLRKKACRVLVELASTAAVEELTEALSDPDDEVRAAVLGALKSLTGRAELTDDPSEWLALQDA